MSQVIPSQVSTRSTKVRLNQDVWDQAIAFVQRENERNPLYRVSLQGVVNEAVRQFCLANRDESEAA